MAALEGAPTQVITALICTHKAGDVLPLALKPLIASPRVHQILIADGPTPCDHKAAVMVDEPSVLQVHLENISAKTHYLYTEKGNHRAHKNNLILSAIDPETTWVLVVDSDEIWSEDNLDRLWLRLQDAHHDRYRVRLWNPWPDFWHHFEIPQENGRIYRWFPDAACPDVDRCHQYVLSPRQTQVDIHHHWGCALLDPSIRPYHLNALRAEKVGHPQECRRVTDNGDGTVTWRGGKAEHTVPIQELPRKLVPEVIVALGRDNL
jgi:hypothetical protein